MSDQTNPYGAPEASFPLERPAPGGRPELTDRMIFYLKAASPWLRFIGILGFVYAGFMFLGGAVFALAGGGMALGGLDLGGFAGAPVLVGVLYAGAGALIMAPSLFAYRYGSKIKAFAASGSPAELEDALRNGKSYFKFYGVVYIVGLAAVALAVVLGVLGAVAAVAMGGF